MRLALQRKEPFMSNINPLLKIGDHLIARRLGYTHHGLYLGDGNVLEYILHDGIIIVPLDTFAAGQEIFIREHKNARYPGIQAVNRGMLRLGENQYNLLTRNCEHFVNWCIDGVESSRQVDNLILTIIPFYSIFKKSDFLKGCLKIVFDDPSSLDQAFARINSHEERAYNPLIRAKELSEDIFGSQKEKIVNIASIFTTSSQLTKEYYDWASKKRHGKTPLIKRALQHSAQAVKQLKSSLGVSFYTQVNNALFSQQSTYDDFETNTSLDKAANSESINNSKFQKIDRTVRDSMKLVNIVNDFLTMSKDAYNNYSQNYGYNYEQSEALKEDSSPANSSFKSVDSDYSQRQTTLVDNHKSSYDKPKSNKNIDSLNKQKPLHSYHESIASLNTLVNEVSSILNNKDSFAHKSMDKINQGINIFSKTINQIDAVITQAEQAANNFTNASQYFQAQANAEQSSSSYFGSDNSSCGKRSAYPYGKGIAQGPSCPIRPQESVLAHANLQDLEPKSALPPSWESKLPKIHITLEPEVFANAFKALNPTSLESALARHALSTQKAQVSRHNQRHGKLSVHGHNYGSEHRVAKHSLDKSSLSQPNNSESSKRTYPIANLKDYSLNDMALEIISEVKQALSKDLDLSKNPKSQ